MDIPNIPDYIIYENGDVWSKERVIIKKDGRKQFCKSQLMTTTIEPILGYLRVGLRVDKKRKQYRVHRLIAVAYLPNPNNLSCVNHIDKNRANSTLENLEWCTNMYNTQSINTRRDFGSITKDVRCNSYSARYVSNGIKHSKNFKKESDAVVHLVIAEIFTKLEAQL